MLNTEFTKIFMDYALINEKYRILIEFIKSEAEEICFDRNKILNFINILENEKDGKENNE